MLRYLFFLQMHICSKYWLLVSLLISVGVDPKKKKKQEKYWSIPKTEKEQICNCTSNQPLQTWMGKKI